VIYSKTLSPDQSLGTKFSLKVNIDVSIVPSKLCARAHRSWDERTRKLGAHINFSSKHVFVACFIHVILIWMRDGKMLHTGNFLFTQTLKNLKE